MGKTFDDAEVSGDRTELFYREVLYPVTPAATSTGK
eukprot:SAG22_NODE_11080_length_502_cov_0.602978_1_plen_35_part_10